MKYEYVTATGKNTIEIDDNWANILIELDRQKHNVDQRETRRHVSLDAYNQDDALFSSDTDIQADYDIYEQVTETVAAIVKLPTLQRELISSIAAGMSCAEYAKRKGVSKAAISQQLTRARKKLHKILL